MPHGERYGYFTSSRPLGGRDTPAAFSTVMETILLASCALAAVCTAAWICAVRITIWCRHRRDIECDRWLADWGLAKTNPADAPDDGEMAVVIQFPRGGPHHASQ